MSYTVYARSASPSQRPAPTTIGSRSLFPLGLCSFSNSLSKMGTLVAPRSRGALEEKGHIRRPKTLLFENARYSAYCTYKVRQIQRNKLPKKVRQNVLLVRQIGFRQIVVRQIVVRQNFLNT